MACLNQRAVNVTVEPLDLYMGNQQMACLHVDNSSDLAGLYVKLSNLVAKIHLWFDDGVAVDPAPADSTEIAVTYTDALTNDVLADNIVSAINALSSTLKIHAKKVVDGSDVQVLIQAKDIGAVADAWADVDSTLEFEVLRLGKRVNLGLIEGDVTIGIEENLLDITAHQFGPELLAQLRLSNNFTLSVTLEEAIKEKISEFMLFSAIEVTPAGMGATPVIGYGALAGSKQFGNTIDDALSLVCHPTKLVESDRSNDLFFTRAYALISEILHSGENKKTFTADFSFYIDEALDNRVSKMMYGDWQQNFLK